MSTKSLVVASILGSIAAACECEFDGNVVIKKSQILDKINNNEELSNYHPNNIMRFIIVGMGVQGLKRQKYLGNNFVCFVDKFKKSSIYFNISCSKKSLRCSPSLCSRQRKIQNYRVLY